MKNELLTIYPILWLVLTFAGAKFSGRRTVAKGFLSLEQTKLIRGSACIGVMIHHVTQLITSYGSADKGVITLFNYAGILFTALFFFFSGYGLILNVYNKETYLHTFLTKRLPAVLIPFWLINLAVVAVKIIFLNVRYVPAKALKDIFGLTLINSNGWFIIEIVVIYLAFFLLFDIIKKKDVAFTLLCIFVILLIRFAFFRGHDNPGAKSSWFRGEWWFNSTITFVFGMFFARFREKILRVVNRFYVVFLPLTAVLFVVAFYFSRLSVTRLGYYGTFQVGMTTRSMFLTLLAQSTVCIISTLLVLLINMRLTFGNPVLKYIGSISMEFFLIHGYFVNQIFGSMKIGDIPRYALCFVTSLACTAAVAPVTGFITKKVTALTGRLEIYNIIPTDFLSEKLHIEKLKSIGKGKLAKGMVVILAILVMLIPAGFVVRSMYLKNECAREYEIIAKANPGDTVLWGRFQTDDMPGRERLEWIVLENDNGRVCLVTKQGITAATYNQKHEVTSWETSDIREKINSESFLKMFSSDERLHMEETDGAYITLLTVSEAEIYFKSDKDRELSITKAAEHEGANINSLSKANEWDLKGYRSSWWWLKGEEDDVYAPIVTVDGEISQKEVNRPGGAVRPVIWIDANR